MTVECKCDRLWRVPLSLGANGVMGVSRCGGNSAPTGCSTGLEGLVHGTTVQHQRGGDSVGSKRPPPTTCECAVTAGMAHTQEGESSVVTE